MLVHKGDKVKNWGGECRDVTPTKSVSQNIRVDVNREVKFLCVFLCVFFSGGQVGGGGGGGGSQGGCEQRIEVFVKIKKKKMGKKIWGGGGRGEGSGLGGQGEKFLGKFTKKIQGGGRGSVWEGVRVDVNGELKFLCKYKKKNKNNFLEGGGVGFGESGWM